MRCVFAFCTYHLDVMAHTKWTWVDSVLVIIAALSAFATIAVRWMVTAPLLAHAIRPFEYSDGPIPFLTRLAISGYATSAGFLLAIILVGGGLLARVKLSVGAGRAVIGLSLIACLGAVATELSGVNAASRADPTNFGVEGVTRCSCPASFLTVSTSFCGCREPGSVSVQVIDSDGDGLFDKRCVYEPPCVGEGPCSVTCGSMAETRN